MSVTIHMLGEAWPMAFYFISVKCSELFVLPDG